MTNAEKRRKGQGAKILEAYESATQRELNRAVKKLLKLILAAQKRAIKKEKHND